uniref:diphosphoinositol-polyphosphate diphosphatase n=1 Tax=Anser cygnoides TaxID=8845 RepID=A0A8B9IGW1_ANSCY
MGLGSSRRGAAGRLGAAWCRTLPPPRSCPAVPCGAAAGICWTCVCTPVGRLGVCTPPRVTKRKKAAQNESLHVLGWWNSLVLLVSSSRHPDRWIVPGGGMEPEEEPNVAAVREVCEEAGVKGTLGRLVGIFENRDRKHRTYVYVLIVTEVLEDWEDSVNIGKSFVLASINWFDADETPARRPSGSRSPCKSGREKLQSFGCLGKKAVVKSLPSVCGPGEVIAAVQLPLQQFWV